MRAWLSEARATRQGMRQRTGLFLPAPGDEDGDPDRAYDQAKSGDAASNLSRLRAGARYEPDPDDFPVLERLDHCDLCRRLVPEAELECLGTVERCKDRDACAEARR